MHRQRGFTLIELLFALLILTLVITTTLAVFVEHGRRLQQASETMIVWQALANEAEMQRRADFALLAPTAQFETDTRSLALLGNYSTRIDVTSTQVGVKNVTMSIRWHGAQRVASLTIIRVDTGGGNLW